MLNQFERALAQLIEERLKNNPDQAVITYYKNILLNMLHYIGLDDLQKFAFPHLKKNLVFNFVYADFSEGLKYLADHGQKALLYEKSKNGSTPLVEAVVTGAWNVINFYKDMHGYQIIIKLYCNSTLSELLMSKDDQQLKNIIPQHNTAIIIGSPYDLLEYAVGLNRTEIVKCIFEDKNLQPTCNIQHALKRAIELQREQIVNYLIDHFLRSGKIDELVKYMEFIDKHHYLSVWFLKLFNNKLAACSELSVADKVKLIKIPVTFMFERAAYTSADEFIQDLANVMALASDQDEYRKKIIDCIVDLIRNWQGEWNTSFRFPMMSFSEKLHCSLEIPNLLDEDQRLTLLIERLETKKTPRLSTLCISYFFNETTYAYRDKNGNNIAHKIAMAWGNDGDMPVTFYILMHLSRALFYEKNLSNQYPADLLPDLCVSVYGLSNKEFTLSQLLQFNFIQLNCLYSRVKDSKWGVMSCRSAEFFTQGEQAISILESRLTTEDKAMMLVCYKLIMSYLSLAVQSLKFYRGYNSKAIVELFNKYYEFGKKYQLLQEEQIKLFLNVFSYYEEYKTALELARQLLASEINKGNETEVIYVKFLLFGLHISDMIRPAPHDIPFENINNDFVTLEILFLKFVVHTDSILSMETKNRKKFIEQFTIRLNEITCTLSIAQGKKQSYDYYVCYIKSCEIVERWACKFFSVSDIEIKDPENASSITQLMSLILEKKQFFKRFIYDVVCDDPVLKKDGEKLENIKKKINLPPDVLPDKDKKQVQQLPIQFNGFSNTPAKLDKHAEIVSVSFFSYDNSGTGLLRQFNFALYSLMDKRLQEHVKQEEIDHDKRILCNMLKLKLISMDAIVSFVDNNKNLAFAFAETDFVEGLLYLFEHGQEALLLKKIANGLTPWLDAILYGSFNAIRFYMEHFDGKNLYFNAFHEAVIKNEVSKVKIILSQWDSAPFDCSGWDPMAYATSLNHEELVKLFFENKLFQYQIEINRSLARGIELYRKEIVAYLIGNLLKQKRLNELSERLLWIGQNSSLNSWFFKLYADLLTLDSDLKVDEKFQLLQVPIAYLFLKADYTTASAFNEDYKKMMSLVPSDEKYRNQIKNWIASWVRSFKKESSTSTRPYAISFAEKLYHAKIKMTFSKDEYVHEIIRHMAAIADADANDNINEMPVLLLYYLLNEDALTYRNDQGNNLAHIAASTLKKKVYLLYQFHVLKPELFQMKNNAGQIPFDLLPDDSLLKQRPFDDPLWKTYHNINSIFIAPTLFYQTVVALKWGEMPRCCDENFTGAEKALLIFRSKKLAKESVFQSYAGIWRLHLLPSIEVSKTHPHKKITAIVKLFKEYYEVAIEHELLGFRPAFIDVFSYFGEYETALNIVQELLQSEMKKKQITEIIHLKFILFGLFVNKMVAAKLNVPSYLSFENFNKNHTSLEILFLKFLDPDNIIQQKNQKQLVKFKEYLDTLKCTFGDNVKTEIKKSPEYYHYFIESCRIMLHLYQTVFVLSKEETPSHEYVRSMNQLKQSFLEKLTFFLSAMSNVMQDDFVYKHCPDSLAIQKKMQTLFEELHYEVDVIEAALKPDKSVKTIKPKASESNKKRQHKQPDSLSLSIGAPKGKTPSFVASSVRKTENKIPIVWKRAATQQQWTKFSILNKECVVGDPVVIHEKQPDSLSLFCRVPKGEAPSFVTSSVRKTENKIPIAWKRTAQQQWTKISILNNDCFVGNPLVMRDYTLEPFRKPVEEIIRPTCGSRLTPYRRLQHRFFVEKDHRARAMNLIENYDLAGASSQPYRKAIIKLVSVYVRYIQAFQRHLTGLERVNDYFKQGDYFKKIAHDLQDHAIPEYKRALRWLLKEISREEKKLTILRVKVLAKRMHLIDASYSCSYELSLAASLLNSEFMRLSEVANFAVRLYQKKEENYYRLWEKIEECDKQLSDVSIGLTMLHKANLQSVRKLLKPNVDIQSIRTSEFKFK